MSKVRYFSSKNAKKVLGIPISDTEINRICKRLGIDRKGKELYDKKDKGTGVYPRHKES